MKRGYLTQAEVPSRILLSLLLLLVVVVVGLRLSSYSIYFVGGLVFLTLTQRKIEYPFFALVLLVSLSVMNNAFFEKGFDFYLVSRGVLFLLAIMMSLRAGVARGAWFLSPFAWLIAYIVYMMGTSLAGWAPVISELKALLFLVFITAMVQSVSAFVQSGVDIRFIRAAMLAVACFYILGSVLVIPFPSIGRSMLTMKLESWGSSAQLSDINGLFNGATWHSQALGPLVAMLNAFLLSDYLCNFRKKNSLYVLLFLMVPILVYMTSSRTALFAYLASLASSIYFFMQERSATMAKKGRILGMALMGVFLATMIVLVRPGGVTQVESFLRKSSETDSPDQSRTLTESITASRKGLVEQGLANFKESPLIGNGFQVSQDMQYIDRTDMGLMLSAPIEKGVLPVMVLEEGGVLGALLFGAFVVCVYAKYRKLQFTCFLSTFTVFLVLNSGEASFFSTSGGGGILWLTCFCALLMDVHRHRRALAEKNAMMVQR